MRSAEESNVLRSNKVVEYHISSGADFYATMPSDNGWGCGYRNIQIMWSFLRKYNPYRLSLQTSDYGVGSVPPISALQVVLDRAWGNGFDPEGAEKFGGCAVGSRKWIGTAECAVVLRSLGVRAKIVDFLPPNAGSKLAAWVWRYFTKDWGEACIPPLYFQHSGHSRTIIGVEKRENGDIFLLLLDPSIRRTDAEIMLDVNHDLKQFRCSEKGLQKKYYQIVYPDGIAQSQEEYCGLKQLAPDERL